MWYWIEKVLEYLHMEKIHGFHWIIGRQILQGHLADTIWQITAQQPTV